MTSLISNPRLLKLLETYELPAHFIKAISDDSQRTSQATRIKKPCRSGKPNENQLSNAEQLPQKQA